jgi:hypothetical protein
VRIIQQLYMYHINHALSEARICAMRCGKRWAHVQQAHGTTVSGRGGQSALRKASEVARGVFVNIVLPWQEGEHVCDNACQAGGGQWQAAKRKGGKQHKAQSGTVCSRAQRQKGQQCELIHAKSLLPNTINCCGFNYTITHEECVSPSCILHSRNATTNRVNETQHHRITSTNVAICAPGSPGVCVEH